MKKLKYTVLVFFFTASACIAGGISSSMLTGAINSAFTGSKQNSLNINNLLGNLTADLPFSLKCNTPSMPDFLTDSSIDSLDMCALTNKLRSLDSLSFNLPICNLKISLADNMLNTVESGCSSNFLKTQNDVLLNKINSIEGIIKASNSNYSFYTSKTTCGDSSNNQNQEEINSNNNFMHLISNNNNYDALFTGAGKTQMDCVKILTSEGASRDEIQNKCSQESLYTVKPSLETEVDIDKQKIDISRKVAKEADIFNPEESKNAEKSLKIKFLSQCSDKSTLEEAAKCENKILEQEKIKTKEKTSDKNINIQTTLYNTAVERATKQDYMLNFPTQDVKDNLPNNMKKKYTFLSKRYLAQQALLKNLSYELNELKKELSKLIYQKREVCSKPFYPSVYKNILKTNMQNVGAE